MSGTCQGVAQRAVGLARTDIGIVGFPHAGGNVVDYLQCLGPRYVRNRSMGCARMPRDYGVDPFAIARISDLGDVPLPRALNADAVAEDAQAHYERIFRAGIIPMIVGGDYSITLPIMCAARMARYDEPLSVVLFDSHCPGCNRQQREACLCRSEPHCRGSRRCRRSRGDRLHVVELPEAKCGFVLLPRRWVAERSFERYAATLVGFHVIAFVGYILKHAADLMQIA